MSNGIAASLALAGLVAATARFAQAELRRQVAAARGRVWSLTRDGVSLQEAVRPQR